MADKPISRYPTPDPWMMYHAPTKLYYLTFSQGDHITIWSSPLLQNFDSPATVKSQIWKPQPSEQLSTLIWAPELHFLNGTWYIYTCAAPSSAGNAGHRLVVLRSSDPDPMNPKGWTFLGPVKGLPSGQWGIDPTVFMLPDATTGEETLYCCYSGWPLGDHSDTEQNLFLVRMLTPEEADPDSLTCISRPTLPWERPDGGKRGINEGPTFLELPPSSTLPAGWKGIVYSADGSWGPDYKLMTLALRDPSNPCNEKSWSKRDVPLLISLKDKGPPFGPGHASYVFDVHGRTSGVYCVFHATENLNDGWNNRQGRVLWLHDGDFAPDAMPMCCAVSMLGQGPVPWNNGQVVAGSSLGEKQQPIGHSAGVTR